MAEEAEINILECLFLGTKPAKLTQKSHVKARSWLMVFFLFLKLSPSHPRFGKVSCLGSWQCRFLLPSPRLSPSLAISDTSLSPSFLPSFTLKIILPPPPHFPSSPPPPPSPAVALKLLVILIVVPLLICPHPINLQCLSTLRLNAIFSPSCVHTGWVSIIFA